MNNQGRGALAEMSPFSRPARSNTINSGWRNASPMVVSGDNDGNLSSGWQRPSYPLVGDAGSFLSENKLFVALGAAVVAGGLAYYFGYR
jgi:hypothetical protein